MGIECPPRLSLATPFVRQIGLTTLECLLLNGSSHPDGKWIGFRRISSSAPRFMGLTISTGAISRRGISKRLSSPDFYTARRSDFTFSQILIRMYSQLLGRPRDGFRGICLRSFRLIGSSRFGIIRAAVGENSSFCHVENLHLQEVCIKWRFSICPQNSARRGHARGRSRRHWPSDNSSMPSYLVVHACSRPLITLTAISVRFRRRSALTASRYSRRITIKRSI